MERHQPDEATSDPFHVTSQGPGVIEQGSDRDARSGKLGTGVQQARTGHPQPVALLHVGERSGWRLTTGRGEGRGLWGKRR